MEQSSSFVEHQPLLQLSLLLSEFHLHQLHEVDGEKDARTGRRRKDRGKVKGDDEPGLACLDKFFDCAKSDCVEKSGDTQGTLSKILVKYKGNLKQEDSIEAQRRVLKDGKNMVLDVSTRKLVASGNSETEGEDKVWPHNFHISKHGVLRRRSSRRSGQTQNYGVQS